MATPVVVNLDTPGEDLARWGLLIGLRIMHNCVIGLRVMQDGVER